MPKHSFAQQLDDALEAVMSVCEMARDDSIPELDPRVADLLRIAADLQGMPSEEFKARLKADLMRAQPASLQPPLTAAIVAKAEPSGFGQRLAAQDLRTGLKGIESGSVRFMGVMNDHIVGVTRLSSQTPLWERYPGGERLLSVLEGAIDLTLLTADGPTSTSVEAGSVFVCPRGMWHWPKPAPDASVLVVEPSSECDRSMTEPVGSNVKASNTTAEAHPGHSKFNGPWNIRAALASVKELRISSATTPAKADASFASLGSVDRYFLGVGRFFGRTPWERHAGDELIHVMDGQVDLTTLTQDGRVETTLSEGEIFVCPQGLWHRQFSSSGVTVFFASPRPTDVSFAEDPRV